MGHFLVDAAQQARREEAELKAAADEIVRLKAALEGKASELERAELRGRRDRAPPRARARRGAAVASPRHLGY